MSEIDKRLEDLQQRGKLTGEQIWHVKNALRGYIEPQQQTRCAEPGCLGPIDLQSDTYVHFPKGQKAGYYHLLCYIRLLPAQCFKRPEPRPANAKVVSKSKVDPAETAKQTVLQGLEYAK